jgi:hypothetical protein
VGERKAAGEWPGLRLFYHPATATTRHAHGQSTSEATAPMWEHDAAQILAGWCVSSLLFQLTPDARQASPVILFQYLQYYIT